MSENHTSAVAIYHENEQQGLRLVELSPEIFSTFTSAGDKLILKSAASGDDTNAGEAVICSSNKTFALRHVQSSNALLLLSPSNNDHVVEHPNSAMSIFASCNGTVEVFELNEAQAGARSPGTWLLDNLPSYNKEDAGASVEALSRSEVFARIPYSDGELHNAWRELAAFEIDSCAFIPSPGCSLELWKDVTREANSLSIDLTGHFSTEDLWNESSLYKCYPYPLFTSFFGKVSNDVSITHDAFGATMDQSKMIDWIGDLLLTTTPSANMQTTEAWVRSWKQLLPVPWHDAVSEQRLLKLKAFQKLPTSTIAGREHISAGNGTDSKQQPNARNWHEKFRKVKK